MLTVEALREILKALGKTGTDITDNMTIPEALLVIAAAIPAAIAAALPAVTASNNGQVLTVSSGKWAAADPASQLPAVSATDNGSVLKVIDGAWGVGTDEIQA